MLSEYNLTVRESMTEPERRGRKPRPIWIVEGKTAAITPLLKQAGGHLYRGKWSFWEDPTETLLALLKNPEKRKLFRQRMEDEAQRRLAAAARFQGLAGKAKERSDAASAEAWELWKSHHEISQGSPIIDGRGAKHASDWRAIDSRYRRAQKDDQSAEYWDRKAAAEMSAAEMDWSPRHFVRRLKEAKSLLKKLEKFGYCGTLWHEDCLDEISFWQEKLEQSQEKAS